jgi:HlyD family secretion protein
MTANLTFQIEKHTGVLAIPNAAFRFFPKLDQVRANDRAMVESATPDGSSPGATGSSSARATSAAAGESPVALAAGQASNHRHVWVSEGELLSAVAIVTGLSDKSSTELVSGGLREGQELVVGMQTAAAKGSSSPPPP